MRETLTPTDEIVQGCQGPVEFKEMSHPGSHYCHHLRHSHTMRGSMIALEGFE